MDQKRSDNIGEFKKENAIEDKCKDSGNCDNCEGTELRSLGDGGVDLARKGSDTCIEEQKEPEIIQFSFGTATRNMRRGKKVARLNWNGPGQYLELQVPDEHSKMTLPYIYIHTDQGDLVPWQASQPDMLSLDWYVVK